MSKYINANSESGKKFFQDYHDKGKVVMLNLLKFRDKADYTNLEHLDPGMEISGEEAYKLYMKHTLPTMKQAGSRLLYFGRSSAFLIGPDSENWDAVLLVEHESVAKFMEFAQDTTYLKTAGHRTAALEDSRLLPTTELKGL